MKRLLTATVTLLILFTPAPALAHPIGGRGDLPLPLEVFLIGGALVLLVSFGALSLLWPQPRLQDGPRYRGRGFTAPLWLTRGLQTAGVAFLVLVIIAGRLGDVDSRINIAPLSIFILFWLVLPFLAAIFGNFWSLVNPWAAIGRLLEFDRKPTRMTRLGVWPAGLLFLAFTWLELVSPSSGNARALALASLVYTLLMLTWMSRRGVDETLASADAFSVYHRLLSAIAPLGRDEDGRLRWRGWLRSLPVLPQWPGLVFFVVAMIGTVSYDGLSATPFWDDLTFDLVGRSQSSQWFGTIALVATVAIVGIGYLAASWWAARIARGSLTALGVARSFAHTLVPIALAYAVAHYITLILFEGQFMIASISDPLGRGWNLFGTADYQTNFTWLSPTSVWWIQASALVGGHVVGVALAHDRALAVFEGERAIRSQYAMLTLMVALTFGGLSILAAG